MTDLTPDHIADLSLLADVAVSPDGRHVAYTVKPVGKAEEHPLSALWLAPLDGAAPPRRFTAGTAEDHLPQWSPDGRSLAFLSDRAVRGTAQLYVIGLDGGEARPLTPAKNKRPVLSFAWSPAGDRIAYTSAAEPSDEDERREKERDDADVFGERWQHARLRAVTLATGEIALLASGARHIAECAWSPRGDALAYFSWEAPPLEFASREVLCQRISASGGEPQALGHITCRPSSLVWSSDGHTLLFLGVATGRAQSSSVVWSLAAEGGEPKRLALGVDSCATGLQQPPGFARAVVAEAVGLETRLCWLDPHTGALDPFYQAHFPGDPGDITAWSVRASSSALGGAATLAFARSSGNRPAEIWGEGITQDEVSFPLQLSNHQAALQDVQFGRQEPFFWHAPDGWALDGIMIHPPVVGAFAGTPAAPADAPPAVGAHPIVAGRDGGRAPLPTIVLVHGGPYGRWGQGLQLNWSNWGQWLALAGYRVLMPNPRGGYGHGDRFASSVRGDVGGADYLDVMSAVDAAVARGLSDPDRLGIGGWSQGGFMTAWAVTQTRRFKAAVMGAGVSDWGMMTLTSDVPDFESELGGSVPWDGVGPHRHGRLSPIAFARSAATPVLILHGQNDARVPLSQAVGFHRALRDVGVASELVVYPREPHGIAERAHQLDLLRRVRAWYARWL